MESDFYYFMNNVVTNTYMEIGLRIFTSKF
jgi:hypothetical protein